MSGVEIVAGAAVVSLIASGVSAYEQIQVANKTAALQSQEIRDQQVQLRLQENQQSIERMKKLQSTLATEEVMFGARNIAPGSGTVRAISQDSVHNFMEDENASKLNYASKQLSLARSRDLAFSTRRAQVFGAVTGFVKEGASAVSAPFLVPYGSNSARSMFSGASAESVGSFDLNA